jgi:hypothetical protein
MTQTNPPPENPGRFAHSGLQVINRFICACLLVTNINFNIISFQKFWLHFGTVNLIILPVISQMIVVAHKLLAALQEVFDYENEA